MNLRWYQQEAVEALGEHWRTRTDNPCIVLPTGAGKSPLLGELCRLAAAKSKRVIVLAHVKELLEQNADKIRAMAPDVPIGVYSAGLGRKDAGYGVTVAGIQSVYRRADLFADVALVIVDEAHLITTKGDGMYRTFWRAIKEHNPSARIIGLTATPYRTGSGIVCRPENILNHVCYEVGVRELMDQGFLTRLRSKGQATDLDTSGLRVRGGEFTAEDTENLMDADAIVESACNDILRHTADRKACLIFTSGVRHCEHVVRVMGEKGASCGMVTGDTPDDQRAETIARFKDGSLKYLANVNVLTTGFDAPHIDCVAMLRPTMSPGLYYQMCGRGFRIFPEKTDCLVLDFGGNIARHGPIDDLRPAKDRQGGGGAAPVKKCPECYEYIPVGVAECPVCGFKFPERKTVTHEATAADDEILSGDRRRRRLVVRGVQWGVHHKKGGRDSFKAQYITDQGVYREWHCFGYGGMPERRAAAWWRKCGGKDPVPKTAQDADFRVTLRCEIKAPSSIRVMKKVGDKYWEIVDHEFAKEEVVS